MEELFDDEIENEIKLRLIMAKSCEDDVLLHAYMLKALFDTYKKYNVVIPNEILNYIKTHTDKMKHEISFKLDKLKKEYDSLKPKLNNKNNSYLENKKYIQINNVMKKKSLFPEGYFDKK